MPYTPPCHHHRSPAPSAPATPEASRRPSHSGPGRPSLPKSSSYIQRHRRSPSAPSGHLDHDFALPRADSVPLPPMEPLHVVVKSDGVRQSPPPVTGDHGMPSGAIISPPESASSDGSDEEGERAPELRGRKLEQLKDAIGRISQPQPRAGSPERAPAAHRPLELRITSPSVKIIPEKVTTATAAAAAAATVDTNSSLPVGRKMGHVRSVTEPNAASMAKSASSSTESSVTSEEDSDIEPPIKPQMVRKKSGELVRPALRPASRRRPSSMPGTPTFSKAVHFDSHLEHVRHFLQVDRPLAVSAGTSPVDNYDSDVEYPFHCNGSGSGSSGSGGSGSNNSSGSGGGGTPDRHGPRSSSFEWELNTRNFPADSPHRRSQPVRLERVWLSAQDQKSLIGSVDVANLDFFKSVVCRFTLDYWKTTSEVAAEYSSEILTCEGHAGHDRFNFSIKLSDMANLESKTLYFCIRYNVAGNEFWDNNSGANFQIDFKKKMVPPTTARPGVQATSPSSSSSSRPAGSLPRSNRRSNPSTAPRPKSVPSGGRPEDSAPAAAAAAAAADKPKFNFQRPLAGFRDDDDDDESSTPGLRFKTKSTSALPTDNLALGLRSAQGQAFATRYDFGASLLAASKDKSAAKDRTDDVLYMKASTRNEGAGRGAGRNLPANVNGINTAAPAAPPAPGTTAAFSVPGTSSPSLSLGSNSYEELVSRYCFFGSKQSSPTIKDGTMRNGAFDGAVHSPAPGAANPRPGAAHAPAVVQHAGHVQHAGPALHHTVHRDSNPYFNTYTVKASTPPSPPAASPVRSLVAVPIQQPQAAGGSPSSPRTTAAVTLRTPSPPLRSVSPASLVGSFQPFAGASPTEEEYSYHAQFQDRFPFSVEAHSATAIRG